MKKLIFIALFVASFCSSFARTKSTSKAKFVAGNLTQIRICTYAVNFAALAAAQGQDTFAIYNNCNTAGGFVLAPVKVTASFDGTKPPQPNKAQNIFSTQQYAACPNKCDIDLMLDSALSNTSCAINLPFDSVKQKINACTMPPNNMFNCIVFNPAVLTRYMQLNTIAVVLVTVGLDPNQASVIVGYTAFDKNKAIISNTQIIDSNPFVYHGASVN